MNTLHIYIRVFAIHFTNQPIFASMFYGFKHSSQL